MTFDDLKSLLEKKNRRSAILDADFKILWDKEGFFTPWKIDFPKKEEFFSRKEIIFSIGTAETRIPVSIDRITLSNGQTYYVCEAFDKSIVSELAAKSEIADLLKNYLGGINDKIQNIQFFAEQCVLNPLVQSDEVLLENYKTQVGAAFDLLALSTNLNYYFNTFSYSDTDRTIDVFKTIDGLVKKCNMLLGYAVITFNSKDSGRLIRISERVFTVVFLNLIQNALLYSKPESKIEVSVFYNAAEKGLTISVTNEIDPAANPHSESIRLGIGLPLVERIVTNLNGKVVGERVGSTYKARITMPLHTRKESEIAGFEHSPAEFITQNDSYIKRYLNRFIQK
ncbi:MAG: sensor histidine kinase [Oscillospiraceae bacterium]|nr:sensor histidine kinase [Oscillospiraceae bacterium]